MGEWGNGRMGNERMGEWGNLKAGIFKIFKRGEGGES